MDTHPSFSTISDESRSDDEKAKRDALRAPECGCTDSLDLCEMHRGMLINYGKLESDMRSLSHEIASLLGTRGDEMSPVVRGRLRVAFTELALPHIPEWNAAFWEQLAGVVRQKIMAKPIPKRNLLSRLLAGCIRHRGGADEKGRVRA